MEQKDYKDIAEIIKARIDFVGTSITEKYQEAVLSVIKLEVDDLADLFERENKEQIKENRSQGDTDTELFNRQQFREWCGVK